MAKRKTVASESWKKWDDPRKTEDNYDKWKKAHNDLVLMRAADDMKDIAGSYSHQAPATLIAARTGLSPETVRKYLRKGDMGKRGPLHTTYLALKGVK